MRATILAAILAAGGPAWSQEAPDDEAIRRAVREILESPDYQPAQSDSSLSSKVFSTFADWFGEFAALRGTAIGWIILAICVAVIIRVLWHVVTTALRRPDRRRKAAGEKPEGPPPEPEELLAAARSAAAAGDAAAALTLYLKAAISGLDRRGVLRRIETATVRDYRRLLSPHPAEAASFETLAGWYEPGVFGRRRTPPEALAACDAAAARLAIHDA